MQAGVTSLFDANSGFASETQIQDCECDCFCDCDCDCVSADQ